MTIHFREQLCGDSTGDPTPANFLAKLLVKYYQMQQFDRVYIRVDLIVSIMHQVLDVSCLQSHGIIADNVRL